MTFSRLSTLNDEPFQKTRRLTTKRESIRPVNPQVVLQRLDFPIPQLNASTNINALPAINNVSRYSAPWALSQNDSRGESRRTKRKIFAQQTTPMGRLMRKHHRHVVPVAIARPRRGPEAATVAQVTPVKAVHLLGDRCWEPVQPYLNDVMSTIIFTSHVIPSPPIPGTKHYPISLRIFTLAPHQALPSKKPIEMNKTGFKGRIYEAFPHNGNETVLFVSEHVRRNNLARRYEVPTREYPEGSLRSVTIVGIAFERMVLG